MHARIHINLMAIFRANFC